jgi:hypothetical protein
MNNSMIHQDTLEETQEILLNVYESLKELTLENLKERIDFITKAFKHLQENVIKEEFIKDTNNKVDDLLKKIKRNMLMFERIALSDVKPENYINKQPMLTHWVKYYVEQVDRLLKNG